MEKIFVRNFGLLTKAEQGRLGRLRVGIAGCGMGSQIAVALCRLGVGEFLLADGDRVEPHNLNRQAFFSGQLGKNKAAALKHLIRGINPQAKVEAWKRFITENNAANLVDAVDIVIDCVDVTPEGLRVSLLLSALCREQGKHYLYPLDVGWGARLYIFSPEGISLGEFLGLKPQELEGIEEIPLEPLMRVFAPVPPYLQSVFARMQKGELGYYPQVVTAPIAAAALVVAAVVRIIRSEPLESAPKYYTFDPLMEVA